MEIITLNGKQIRDLAELAGFVVMPQADYDLESEYTISECPSGGLTDDNVTFDHYRYVARCDECPEEGFVGLGDAVKK